MSGGFNRTWLHEWECRALYEAGYPCPPYFRAATGWHLSNGGIPIPPLPVGDELVAEIERARSYMDEADRAAPCNAATNFAGWTEYFREKREKELEEYEGPPPPPKRKNCDGRLAWWGVPGRTLHSVLAHIEAGNTPPLDGPRRAVARGPRRGSAWAPRRTTMASSSSTSASRSGGPPAYSPPAEDSPLLQQVKREAASAASPPPSSRTRYHHPRATRTVAAERLPPPRQAEEGARRAAAHAEEGTRRAPPHAEAGARRGPGEG